MLLSVASTRTHGNPTAAPRTSQATTCANAHVLRELTAVIETGAGLDKACPQQAIDALLALDEAAGAARAAGKPAVDPETREEHEDWYRKAAAAGIALNAGRHGKLQEKRHALVPTPPAARTQPGPTYDAFDCVHLSVDCGSFNRARAIPKGNGANFWSGWSMFINYAAPIAMAVALATVEIPGVDVVTGGIALATDSASAFKNRINGLAAAKKRNYGSAAWDLGSAAFSSFGVVSVARALSLARGIEGVQDAASDVAAASIGAPLYEASSAGSLAERMAAIRTARGAAASLDQYGAEFDEQLTAAKANDAALRFMISSGG